MVDRAIEITTCAESLLNPGTCCTDGCTQAAVWAYLDEGALIEHTRCPGHLPIKPLTWEPLWAPTEGRGTDG